MMLSPSQDSFSVPRQVRGNIHGIRAYGKTLINK
jgi:hypothetical protein